MGVFYRCDGCGSEMASPAMEGRHVGVLAGDDVPPPRFEWCRLCAAAAFAAVAGRLVQQRRRALPAGETRYTPGVAVLHDETQVMPVPAGVAQGSRWLPRGGRR